MARMNECCADIVSLCKEGCKPGGYLVRLCSFSQDLMQ